MGLGPLNSGLNAIGFALFVLKTFALIDVARHPAAAYPAAGKQTKGFWLIILGIAVAVDALPLLVNVLNAIRAGDIAAARHTNFSGFIGIFGIVGVIAALVYLLDARPAVKSIGGGGGRRQGPYGPW